MWQVAQWRLPPALEERHRQPWTPRSDLPGQFGNSGPSEVAFRGRRSAKEGPKGRAARPIRMYLFTIPAGVPVWGELLAPIPLLDCRLQVSNFTHRAPDPVRGHAQAQLVAEPDRDVVQHPGPQTVEAVQLPCARGPEGKGPAFHRLLQPHDGQAHRLALLSSPATSRAFLRIDSSAPLY